MIRLLQQNGCRLRSIRYKFDKSKFPSFNNPDGYLTREKCAKLTKLFIMVGVTAVCDQQTLSPTAHTFALQIGFAAFLLSKRLISFDSMLDRELNKLFATSPHAAKLLAVSMLATTLYLIFFSDIKNNLDESGKQSARPQSAGDKPVLNELTHWMAQDFYFYCKDAITEQYLIHGPEERADYINQIRRRELPLAQGSVNTKQAALIASNLKAYGHALLISQAINLYDLLDGKKEINDELKTQLAKLIGEKISEFYLQDEQEAIYRYMGDICTDIINQNLNDFRSK